MITMLKRLIQCVLLAFLPFFGQLAHAANLVKLKNVAVISENGHTKFEADLTKAIGFSVTAETAPNRVIIEMPRVEFELPTGAGHDVAGIISAYRYGVADGGKSRIVIETKKPVVISWSTVKSAHGNHLPRMLVDLIETSQEGYADTLARDNGDAPPVETAGITPAGDEPAQAPHKMIIALDPGHGGQDPGASSEADTHEKDVVLAYALALKQSLIDTGHYEVVMTRDSDTFVRLHERVKLAHDNKADLFIAIHADTLDDPDVRGTTLYTVSDKASDAEAGDLAQKENKADVIAGMDLGKQTDEVSNVLINLAQRESKNQAMFFAKKAIAEIKPITQMTGKPIRSAGFVVLKAPDVPSVLVELGYLSNKQDEAMLISPEWRNKMAAALTKSIDAYFMPVLSASVK
jgi:N-acetylmuramoyl-L-alanine amidase